MVTVINVRKVIYGFVRFHSPQYSVRKYAGNVWLHVRTLQAAGASVADLNTGYPDTVYRGLPQLLQVKVRITSEIWPPHSSLHKLPAVSLEERRV